MKSFIKLNVLLFRLFIIGLNKSFLTVYNINHLKRIFEIKYSVLYQYFYLIIPLKYNILKI